MCSASPIQPMTPSLSWHKTHSCHCVHLLWPQEAYPALDGRLRTLLQTGLAWNGCVRASPAAHANARWGGQVAQLHMLHSCSDDLCRTTRTQLPPHNAHPLPSRTSLAVGQSVGSVGEERPAGVSLDCQSRLLADCQSLLAAVHPGVSLASHTNSCLQEHVPQHGAVLLHTMH